MAIEVESVAAGGHQPHEKDTLDLVIRTPIGDWEHSFLKTEKVSAVIAETLNQFSTLEPGDYTLQTQSGETLDLHRNLVSYHLKDGDVIKLIPPDGGGQ